jgi:hypothetical protein
MIAGNASAVLIVYSDPSGLGAEADFTLINPTTLQVRLKNTSTGVPDGFSNSDQILTGVSWDFDPAGSGGPNIIGGSVMTGATSFSIGFDILNVGSNADVSGEWGYSNNNGSGMMQNFITATRAQSTSFGGANLDGPVVIDGPSAGLISSAFSLPLGGIGAIQDEIVATLFLDTALSDLSFLDNGTRVEFGSDAHFISVPGPAAWSLLGLLAVHRRRRRG